MKRQALLLYSRIKGESGDTKRLPACPPACLGEASRGAISVCVRARTGAPACLPACLPIGWAVLAASHECHWGLKRRASERARVACRDDFSTQRYGSPPSQLPVTPFSQPASQPVSARPHWDAISYSPKRAPRHPRNWLAPSATPAWCHHVDCDYSLQHHLQAELDLVSGRDAGLLPARGRVAVRHAAVMRALCRAPAVLWEGRHIGWQAQRRAARAWQYDAWADCSPVLYHASLGRRRRYQTFRQSADAHSLLVIGNLLVCPPPQRRVCLLWRLCIW